MPKIVFNAGVVVGDPLSPSPTSTTITVIDKETGLPAELWSNSSGSSTLGNPYTIANPGIIKFYTDDGLFDITATSGAFSITWPDVLQKHLDPPEVLETTAARTLVRKDRRKFIKCTNAAGCAITIPPQSSVAWPNDVEITGVGTLENCTFLEGLGVSIVKPEGRLLECYKGAPWALRRLSLNSWLLTGYLVEA